MRWATQTLVIPGYAAGLTASSTIAEPWKQAVADAVRKEWAGGFLREPVRLELLFGLPPGRFRMTAVYNLLKATVDGLSNVIFAPSPSGQRGPWAREDWWVHGLVAEKRIAPVPFVSIGISPYDALSTSPKVPPLLTIVVPGAPPPWPGDSPGQRRVREWRERAIALVAQPPLTVEQVMCRLQFVVAPSRFITTDLDNLCIPACQTAIALAFGDDRQRARLVRIEATKSATSFGEDPYAVLSVFEFNPVASSSPV